MQYLCQRLTRTPTNAPTDVPTSAPTACIFEDGDGIGGREERTSVTQSPRLYVLKTGNWPFQRCSGHKSGPLDDGEGVVVIAY